MSKDDRCVFWKENLLTSLEKAGKEYAQGKNRI